MLKPVPNLRVSDQVAQQLRNLLFAREFAPGSRLPTERDLAARLQVHRSSLREALKRLEAEGLIDIRRGDGIYARDFLREANLGALEAFLFATPHRQQDVFRGIQEFRILIQREMTRLAALRRRSEHVSEFETIVATGAATEDPRVFRELDWCFAQTLARASGNFMFTLVLNSVRDLHERWGDVYFSVPGTLKTTRRFHRLIARAIRRQDSVRAGSLMVRLLEYSNPIILDNVPKSLLSGESPR